MKASATITRRSAVQALGVWLGSALLAGCAYAYSPTTIVVGPTVHNLQFDGSGALAYVEAWVG